MCKTHISQYHYFIRMLEICSTILLFSAFAVRSFSSLKRMGKFDIIMIWLCIKSIFFIYIMCEITKYGFWLSRENNKKSFYQDEKSLKLFT